MGGNRKIFFIIVIDYKKSMEEIKSRKSGFFMEVVDKALKVAAPFRTKIVLTFLKVEKAKILAALNEYLQEYNLGQVGNIAMEEVANQKICVRLEDTKIDYQELSELDVIQKTILKKVIRNMKYSWVEESVISLLNTEMINKKVLKELSPAASELFREKWGIYASISSFGVI